MLHSKTLVPVSLGPILAGHFCFKAEEEAQDLQLLFLGANSCMEAQYHSNRNRKGLELAAKQERVRSLEQEKWEAGVNEAILRERRCYQRLKAG